MLGRLAARLGFILCLALTVRGIAFVFAPTHPQPPRVIPDATAFAPGDPVPTSPEMRRAIEQVKASGGESNGAQLHYGRGEASVTVTPEQLAAARAIVRRDREAIDRQMAQIEAEERPDAVSFEPGQPMVDPNPDAH
ncbi:hypothetical protein FHS95_003062 [Sphingomonas naasensis]|uniref:Uncharacterized protein n=1 Tax=Sphingomonas naasensis TaxID=1344951 RepID=A0A4S1WDL6_9SPHN|nr:hypothetical protein [Sphingomonas naasensis]NIJ21359.1 hypothetical protein [Sphingomonas naasensis]TGX38786.1 hypothetical protein E5A74_18340 [Sphingomonas naasensis]